MSDYELCIAALCIFYFVGLSIVSLIFGLLSIPYHCESYYCVFSDRIRNEKENIYLYISISCIILIMISPFLLYQIHNCCFYSRIKRVEKDVREKIRKNNMIEEKRKKIIEMTWVVLNKNLNLDTTRIIMDKYLGY